MNEDNIKTLQAGKEEDFLSILGDFNAKSAQAFSFPELNVENKQRIVEVIVKKLDVTTNAQVARVSLETLRILSRDKTGLEYIVTEQVLEVMVKHAGLKLYAETEGENITIQEGDPAVIIEAQKCLCNVIFQSPVAQRHCSNNGCLEGIVQRLKTYKDPDLEHDIKFYDMRVLFLLTALVTDIRPKMVHQLHGFTYLIEVLDLVHRSAEEKHLPLDSKNVDLACEVLKILFNLTIAMDKNNLDEEEEAHFMRLVSILHDLLVCETEQKDKKEEIESHTVNLLVNMPKDSYEELLTPMIEGDVAGADNKYLEYDGKNMEAVLVLLAFLDKRLENMPKGHMKEGLTPVLHALCEICRANRAIRKFCRIRVLPHLRTEVKRLPEEGESLRNKLCKLFTNPVHEIKDLAADFCFVLCKENVSRFVKYTGYGNAAGLLAQRGLMCGGRGSEYSSESDESDTEEYLELASNVNPITGRWELPQSNPMENMTEEQKEYEAMKLVSEIDKLSRSGVIQPMTIGADGKPHAVSHVLEMLDNQLRFNPVEGPEGNTSSQQDPQQEPNSD